MELTHYAEGYYTHPEDPGEPSTNARRVSVTDDEAALLALMARGQTVLEIGTGLGISTRAMADDAAAVYTIDPDPWVHEHVWPTFRYPVVPLPDPGKCSNLVTYTMAFIDADHRYEPVMADLDFAVSHVPRGIIVCHDTIHVPDVARAMDDFFGKNRWLNVKTHHGIGIAYVGWQCAPSA